MESKVGGPFITLTIDLAPQTEAWLSAEAKQLGLKPADVARIVLEERVAANPHLDMEAATTQSPAEMLLGLFSSPADAALMDEVARLVYEGRAAGSTRDLGV